MAGPGSTAAPGSKASPGSNVVELLHPGSFVRLRDHPEDLPPFQLIRRRGTRCWVRQQAWGSMVHLELPYRRLTAAA
ncbi:hypothetical protein KBZ08_10630 [Cyanobium sp. Candia 9D4]|jgi:hypothetical protein|uniref:hypothetical protein n=1 Tax=Cyanobium sp. Candia 9D4 TaxID=2823707 RepID=UPI0020CBE6DC|nr:hypothetical protein [Cyanobium sp. Candia 9D4]MCP9934363.1 hypothetical protein [Cyanobium sp. Candia 9D4]